MKKFWADWKVRYKRDKYYASNPAAVSVYRLMRLPGAAASWHLGKAFHPQRAQGRSWLPCSARGAVSRARFKLVDSAS